MENRCKMDMKIFFKRLLLYYIAMHKNSDTIFETYKKRVVSDEMRDPLAKGLTEFF